MLTKAQILSAAKQLPSEVVHVPELGGDVRVRVMTGAERDRFDLWAVDQREKPNGWQNMRARLCALTMMDQDTGERMFGDNEIEPLGELSWHILDRIYSVATRINRLDNESIETAEKNSAPEQTGDLSSPSPSASGAP
jgi:hypothetical protein